jgi:hypothetical protein
MIGYPPRLPLHLQLRPIIECKVDYFRVLSPRPFLSIFSCPRFFLEDWHIEPEHVPACAFVSGPKTKRKYEALGRAVLHFGWILYNLSGAGLGPW